MEVLLAHSEYPEILPDKEASIRSDRDKITAVLINLVNNAIKFTHKGYVKFGYKKIDHFLEFYVKDTGEGIREEKIDVIFERFMQGDKLITRNYEGTGLGLSISKAYAEMLGGKIWVESEYGTGSTFYFSIPYVCASSAAVVPESVEKEQVDDNNHNKLKILIAEDDETSVQLIKKLIKTICKTIFLAKSGTEAVEICRDNPDIDVVLMDIRMPDMDGYEATRKIREFNKGVIIIAQTAFTLTGDREKAISAGCNDYISKPIDKDNLLRLIDLHLRERKV